MSDATMNRPDHREPEEGTQLQRLAKRTLVVSGVVTLVASVVFASIWAIDVVLLTFIGILIALLLRGLGTLAARYTGLSHGVATAISALTVMLLIGLLGAWLFPTVAAQSDEIRQSVPQGLDTLKKNLEHQPWGPWVLKQIDQPRQLLPSRQNIIARLTGVVSTLAGALGLTLLVIILGLYLAAQPDLYRHGLLRLIPPVHRPHVADVLADVADTLQGWLAAKFLSMTVVGLLTCLGLWLLGVKAAIALAVIAAILTFVPNFGPVIAAVPAMLVALLNSPMTAVWVAVLYLGVQLLESYLITPLIQYRTISIPPALTLVTQLLLGTLVGPIGLALAGPLVAATMTFVNRFYVEDLLDDHAKNISV